MTKAPFLTELRLVPPRVDPLAAFDAGLARTGLAEDIADGRECTLIAPTNEAFRALPWDIEELLTSDDHAEVLFDLFEYLVLPDHFRADGPLSPRRTMLGETIYLGRGSVVGRHGAARVLRTFRRGGALVHVVNACVLATSPVVYALDVPCLARA